MQETNIRQQLVETNQKFRDIFSSIDEHKINKVPFRDSWTPAQVAQHVLKSEYGMLQVLQAPAKEANRDTYAIVPQLKHIFLDFTTKLKSPEMVIPEQKDFDKAELLQQLNDVSAKLNDIIPKLNDCELVTSLPTGDLTKGEIVHFLLYHTKRHIHQMEHVIETLAGKTKAATATQKQVIDLVNDAFIKNDMPLFLSYCTDDVVWNIIGDKTIHGRDAILGAMTGKAEEGPDSVVEFTVTEGNRTAGTGRFSMANKDGEKKTYRYCDIYTFRDDKIASMDSYVVAVK